MVGGASGGPGEQDVDSNGSLVSDSDNSDQSDDTDDEKPPDAASRPKRKTPKISALMSQVYTQVDLLYHLALLLRRPAIVGRYIKSATKGAEKSCFAPHDYNHVQQKFRCWRSVAEPSLEETEPAQCTDFSQQPSETSLAAPNSQETPQVEEARSESDLESRRRMESEEKSYDLICRLARANTRRREQLNYWAAYPVRSAIDSEGSPVEKKPSAKRLPAHDSAQRSPSRAGEDAMTKAQSLKKHDAKSLISTPTTLVSHSTAAVSRIDGARTQAGPPPTIYAETVVGTGLRSTRVPDPPDPGLGNSQFECPFCHMNLETVLIKDRASWK